MNLLKIKAKVLIKTEDDMELEEMDIGIIAKSKEWDWRDMGIPVYQIYKIIAYSRAKSIVELYDGDKILVMEGFESLYKRWEEAARELDIPDDPNPEGETISEEDDE